MKHNKMSNQGSVTSITSSSSDVSSASSSPSYSHTSDKSDAMSVIITGMENNSKNKGMSALKNKSETTVKPNSKFIMYL